MEQVSVPMSMTVKKASGLTSGKEVIDEKEDTTDDKDLFDDKQAATFWNERKRQASLTGRKSGQLVRKRGTLVKYSNWELEL